MRWIIRLFWTVALLVVLGVAALFLIPQDRIARLAADRFETATGRSLTIGGDVSASLFPRLGITVGDFQIANPDWVVSGPLLRADEARIGVDLMALIRGNIVIENVTLSGADIRLERAVNGNVSWDFGPGQARPFVLNQGDISGGRLTYIDHANGSARTDITDLDLTMRLPEAPRTARITGTGTLNGAHLQMDASINSFDEYTAGQITPLQAHLSASGLDLRLDGMSSMEPMAFEGSLELDTHGLAAVARALGHDLPPMQSGLGRDRFAISGQLTLSSGNTLHLRESTIQLDDHTLLGGFDLQMAGDRPHVNARFSTDTITLPQSGGASDGWATSALPANWLHATDGQVQLSAGTLTYGDIRLENADILTTLDRSRAVFNLNNVAGFGGAVSGTFVMNNRNGLSVGGNLRFSGISVRQMLSAFAGSDRMDGTGALNIEFLGVGNSVDAIMKNLSGTGSVNIRDGEIRGLDLQDLMRNLDSRARANATTPFDAITGSFSLAEGVLRNSDMVFEAPRARATGAGRINLGQRRMNYTVTPDELLPVGEGRQVAVPVKISGPWSNLRIQPDLQSIIEDAIVEDLREQVETEIDIQQQQLEEQLRNEVENQLLDLLSGGN